MFEGSGQRVFSALAGRFFCYYLTRNISGVNSITARKFGIISFFFSRLFEYHEGMTPQENRLDMNVHAALKRLVLERAEQEGKTLNEVVTELLCEALGVEAKDYTVPRKAPGRKPGKKGEADSKKRKRVK